MRTNIDIDEEKITQYMKLGSFKTKKDAIDDALKTSIRLRLIQAFDKMRGENVWVGNLEEMRTYDKWNDSV